MTASQTRGSEPRVLRATRSNVAAWVAAANPSSFVGRRAALEAIDKSLLAGQRLVTLVGPPGIGKTRLATRYAETRGGTFQPGGAWFVDLTLARDDVQVSAT